METEQRRADEKKNRDRTLAIRREKEALRKRREKQRLEHERKLQEDYARRMKAEADKAAEAERVIKQMEEEEASNGPAGREAALCEQLAAMGFDPERCRGAARAAMAAGAADAELFQTAVELALG